jgi:predicted GNAT family N-acyltransferase
MSEFEIRTISAEDTHALRHALLRPHQDIIEMTWPGDDLGDTLHVGGFRQDRLVGISTVHRQRLPGSTEIETWRVRGIAVDHGQRGYGLGGLLLRRCIEHAAIMGGRIVWSNAKVGVFGFYEHYGFRRFGDPFELPDIGPHYLMYVEMEAPIGMREGAERLTGP